MAAYLKVEGMDGEAKEEGHKKWILIESMSAPIYRAIPAGAKDMQRTQGTTTIGDVVIVRQVDASSPKLQKACAAGDLIKEVTIDLCNKVKGKEETYLQYKLANCIVTSYSFHGNASGSPLPTEQVTMNFTKADWVYTKINADTGAKEGQVPASYDLATGKAT